MCTHPSGSAVGSSDLPGCAPRLPWPLSVVPRLGEQRCVLHDDEGMSVAKLAEKFFYDFSLYKTYFHKHLTYENYVAV